MLILLWGGPMNGQAVNYQLELTEPGATVSGPEFSGGRYRIVGRMPAGSPAEFFADWAEQPNTHEAIRISDLEARHDSDQGEIADLRADGVTDRGMIASLEAVGVLDRDTIAHLQADGLTDRDMIASLEAVGVLDRDMIANLQAGGLTDQGNIAILEAVGIVDRGVIANLEADGVVVRDRVANLEIALVSARRIGAAIGLIMALRRISEAEAFEVLREASRTTHRKLRDVAEDVLLMSRENGPKPTRSSAADDTSRGSVAAVR